MEKIDGKATAAEIRQEVAGAVKEMLHAAKRPPHLAAVLVGNDPASETYVNAKVRACEEVGFRSTLFRKEADISETALLDMIRSLNNDKELDGYIVQLPLPAHIDEQKVIMSVAPEKDVDGFHPRNLGRLVLALPTYISATPLGIMTLLDRYKIPTEGRHCVVLGRSHIVGSPVSILMARKASPGNCTVTLCHSRTPDVAEQCRRADILIAAIGKPSFVTADMVKEGAVVVDVGIHRLPDSSKKSGFRLCGDVDYDAVAPKTSFITPVPGGVGPMTIASLLLNTLKAARKEVYS